MGRSRKRARPVPPGESPATPPLSAAPILVWIGPVIRALACLALLPLLLSCSAHEQEPHGEVRIGGTSASTAQRGNASWYGEDFRGKPRSDRIISIF